VIVRVPSYSLHRFNLLALAARCNRGPPAHCQPSEAVS
jgi:hypothetical protein